MLEQYTEAELDFVLEMYAQDNPDQYSFMRGQDKQLSAPEQKAAWERAFSGKAKVDFMPKIPLAAIMKRAHDLREAVSRLRQSSRGD